MKKSRKGPLTSKRSEATKERVVTVLAQLGRATRKDVAKHLGISDTHARTFLSHLERISRVICVEPARITHFGLTSALWALNSEKERTSGIERTVVLARASNVGMQRDPLVAALFGAARQVA